MSNLIPEGNYAGRVIKAEKDILRDGSEVLALQFMSIDSNGTEHLLHYVIQTQEKLDEFLVSVGYPPGSMTLAPATKEAK